MDVELVGANKHAQVISAEEQAYYENHFTPGTGKNGATAHAYNRITYKDIYPNIDWVLYTSAGKLKHEFVVRKGGKVSDIKLKYGGATNLEINNEGSVIAKTPQGSIIEHAPYSFQKDGKTVASSFRLGGDVLSYEIGAYEGDLTIDPNLIWGTYYGSEDGTISCEDVATDGSGNVYMGGNTSSAADIATSGSYQATLVGSTDAFLVKFNSAGVRQWATYYGGGSGEQGKSVATDASGNVYVTGVTFSSSGIATAGAFKATLLGSFGDAFLVKFNSAGVRQWATYYGETGGDGANSVATDGTGNVYIVGNTSSTASIATAGAFQTTPGNGFLVKFNSAGTRLWGTYLPYYTNTIATDGSGNVFFAGEAYGTSGFATIGAHQPAEAGIVDCFLAKFNSSGARQWATYYGGANNDFANSLATDGSGNVFLAGHTESSSGIATTGSITGGSDAFLVKFNGAGVRQWGMYWGGAHTDEGNAVCTDRSGNAYLAGYGTYLSGAWEHDLAFVIEVNSAGTLLWNKTYYSGDTYAKSVATDMSGSMYLAGRTSASSGIVTSGAHITTHPGDDAGFLAKFGVSPITGDSSICRGGTTTLSSASTGGTWSSSSPYATISSAGVFTSATVGTYIATYTIAGAYTTATVTVNPYPSYITGTASVCVGAGTTLSTASAGGTWSSSNSSVATIGTSSGIVATFSTGTTVISYTLPTGCATTTTLSANPNPGPVSGTLTVCVGYTSTATNLVSGGTWSSANPTIANFTATPGVYTGIAAGTTNVTYTLAGGCKSVRTVTVNPIPANILGTKRICDGAVTSLSSSVTYGTWLSTNPAVGSVSATGIGTSIVTGLSAGYTTISFTSAAGCMVRATVTIDPIPAGITGTLTICKGYTTTLASATAGGTWASGATGYASVNSGTGVVTGNNAGTATITYTSAAGCITTAIVTINPIPPAITGVQTACVGASTTLASGTGGAWVSAYPSLATVGSTGIVTGIAAGVGTISYLSAAGCMVRATVTINPNPAAITGILNICPGGTTTLNSATTGGVWTSGNSSIATINSTSKVAAGIAAGSSFIRYTLGTGCMAGATLTVSAAPPNITGTPSACVGSYTFLSSGTGGTWSSGYPGFATVDTYGMVTGVSAGYVNISYTLPGGCYKKVLVTINAVPAAITGTLSMCAGASSTLNCTTAGGTWSSGNPSVATINSSTKIVSGISGGTAGIFYTLPSGCASSAIVTVNPTPVNITGTFTVCPGSTTSLSTMSTGGTWSSGNTSIATISTTGTVTGVAPGTSVITYTLPTACKTTSIVTVNASPGAGTISGTTSVIVGNTTTLTSTVMGGSWMSSNGTVATISPLAPGNVGLVTAVASGTSTIYYSVTNSCGTTSTSTVVTVNAPCTAWVNVGTPGFSAGYVDFPSMAIDGSGTPYVVFRDNMNGAKATVMKYASGSWSVVGSTGFSADYVGNTHIAIAPDGTPYVAYRDNGNGGKITVMKYSGSSWDAVGTAGFSDSVANETKIAIGESGIPYVAFADVAQSGKLTVMKYSGGSWATVGSAGLSAGATEYISITIDGSGTPYVAYKDLANSFKATVLKYSGGSWAPVGSPGFTTNGADYTSIATDGTGTPYLAFMDQIEGKAMVMKYTAGSWGFVGIAGISAGYAPFVSLAIAPDNTPYLAYRDTENGYKATVMKFASGSWAAAGSVGISPGGVSATSLAIDGSGTPHIAYIDLENGSKASMQKLASSVSAITGTASVCTGATTTLSNATSGGTWSSSNVATAAIGTGGIVNGIAAGTTNITYTALSGCTVSKTVTVTAMPASIGGTAIVCEGATATLTNETSGGTWSSSNANATVGITSGVLTGVTNGTATISYTVGVGCYSTKVATINATPSAITGTAALCSGGTTTLANATTPALSWVSSTTSVATVNSGTGIVTGIAPGTTTITYTISGGCNTTKIITVNAAPADITGASGVCVGSNITLSNTVGGGTWAASNANATVGTTGIVTGVTAGTTVITYTTGTGCTKTKTLAVNASPAASGGYKIACVALTTQLTNVSGGVWSSSDTFIAKTTVGGTNAVVTGIAPGTANITFTLAATGCYQVTEVTVKPVPPAITGTQNVCVSLQTTLANTLAGGSWSSSNTAYATVGSATGIVTAGTIAGQATISYNFGANCRVTYIVTVRAIPNVISGPSSLCLGTTATFSSTTTGGTWSSSNTAVGTLAVGTYPTHAAVTGVGSGATILSYTNAPSCTRTYSLPVAACRGVNTTQAGNIQSVGGTYLYPNPTTGMFTISAHESGALTVYTIEGREISNHEVGKGETQIILPAELARGIYMCRFNGVSGSTVIVRLVLE
jgi:uncharacterized protein YjdB